MQIRKEIWHGEMIPAWYGVAWVRYDRDSAVCYPVPFNLVAAALRGIWIWMRHGYRSVPSSTRDAYAQGLQDGKRSNVEVSSGAQEPAKSAAGSPSAAPRGYASRNYGERE